MTAIQFGKLALPGWSDELIEDILWSDTRFPFYDFKTEMKVAWKQLRHIFRLDKFLRKYGYVFERGLEFDRTWEIIKRDKELVGGIS